MSLLKLQDISKTFGNEKVLDSVSFEIPQGSIFGLLGPNGAGKTTLIRIITNIIASDSGQLFLNDEPLVGERRSLIGYMPEERGLYKKMKVGEQLIYLARLRDLSKKEAKEKIDGWLEKFEITGWWNKRISDLSKGMQQKIQFISTVVHSPKLLILDEPFSGLDPINTNLIKSEIRQLCEEGSTVIFSTHRMEQVEEICDHIVLIDKGQKILEGEVKDVKQKYKKNEFSLKFEGAVPETKNGFYSVLKQSENEMIIRINEGHTSNEVLQAIIKQETTLTGFNEILPSLNEIFISQVENQNEK